MNYPLISVIIPTHTRGILLKRAIESINIQYSRNLIEIILVSDVIDLETDLIASKTLNQSDYYVRRSGLPGPAESRNIGIALSKGKFIMFLDDDDSWHPDFIKKFLSNINYQSFPIAYMNCLVIKESRPLNGPQFISDTYINTKDLLNNNIYVKNQVHMSCYIFERNIISSLKFDPSLRAYEDWDFQLSSIDKIIPIHIDILSSLIYEVDDTTTDRRGSTTQATDFNAALDYLSIYRKHPAPSLQLKEKRRNLLSSVNLDINEIYL